MLAQHLVTRPIFEALFAGYDFAAEQPRRPDHGADARLARRAQPRRRAARPWRRFYDSVRRRVEGVDNAEGKQRIIVELYDKFFATAFKKTVDQLGIVYTPVEIVDFILRSADEVLRERVRPGPHRRGRPHPRRLHRHRHLHRPAARSPASSSPTTSPASTPTSCTPTRSCCSPTTSPPSTSRPPTPTSPAATRRAGATSRSPASSSPTPSSPTRTTTATTSTSSPRTTSASSASGSSRSPSSSATRPTRSGRTPPTTTTPTQKYPTHRRRDPGRPTPPGRPRRNKNSLYDSYIRAIKWASLRIEDRGVIAFVTNGGFLDSNTADGMRQDPRRGVLGHPRLQPARQPAHRWRAVAAGRAARSSAAGRRATVAITVLVKNPAAAGPAARPLHRHRRLPHPRGEARQGRRGRQRCGPRIGRDHAERARRLAQPARERLRDVHAARSTRREPAIFARTRGGLKTNRDAWVYNFGRRSVAAQHATARSTTYQRASTVGRATRANDPTQIKLVIVASIARLDARRASRPRSRSADASRDLPPVLPAVRSTSTCAGTTGRTDCRACSRRRRTRTSAFYVTGTRVAARRSASSWSIAIPDLHVCSDQRGQFFPRWTLGAGRRRRHSRPRRRRRGGRRLPPDRQHHRRGARDVAGGVRRRRGPRTTSSSTSTACCTRRTTARPTPPT